MLMLNEIASSPPVRGFLYLSSFRFVVGVKRRFVRLFDSRRFFDKSFVLIISVFYFLRALKCACMLVGCRLIVVELRGPQKKIPSKFVDVRSFAC